MTPSVSAAADVLAVTATICRLVPSATVWREPDICWPLASITVRATEAGKRTATHTVTDRVVTCRSTGPARTWGRLFRRDASVVQVILASRRAIRTTTRLGRRRTARLADRIGGRPGARQPYGGHRQSSRRLIVAVPRRSALAPASPALAAVADQVGATANVDRASLTTCGWRLVPVFAKTRCRWVFAVVLAMPRTVAASS